MIDQLNEQLYEYDCVLEHWARTRYEESSRLTQVKGVGPLTALTFMLTVGIKSGFPEPAISDRFWDSDRAWSSRAIATPS